MKPSVPILCYRNVSPVCGIAPEEFRAHLEWLAAHGWHAIPLDQVIDYLKGGAEPPKLSFALTFDDCYLDNWVHAAPILRDYGFKAAFGVATAYLHDGHGLAGQHHRAVGAAAHAQGPPNATNRGSATSVQASVQ